MKDQVLQVEIVSQVLIFWKLILFKDKKIKLLPKILFDDSLSIFNLLTKHSPFISRIIFLLKSTWVISGSETRFSITDIWLHSWNKYSITV